MLQLVLKGLRLPAAKTENGSNVLEDYAGKYLVQPWDSEQVIAPWGNDLARLTLPSSDPAKDLKVLRRVGGESFRKVRDDETLGPEVTFRRDAAGRVTGYVIWNAYVPKLGP